MPGTCAWTLAYGQRVAVNKHHDGLRIGLKNRLANSNCAPGSPKLSRLHPFMDIRGVGPHEHDRDVRRGGKRNRLAEFRRVLWQLLIEHPAANFTMAPVESPRRF